MMGAIGPGDWVERMSHLGERSPLGFELGTIHQVAAVINGYCKCGNTVGFTFVGLSAPEPFRGGCALAFRPIFSDPQAVTRSIHDLLTVPAPGELVEAQ